MRRSTARRSASVSLMAISLFCGAPHDAEACSVPVFRYALEHWPPDAYEAWIVHRGELRADERALVERFEREAAERRSNVVVRSLDLARASSDELAASGIDTADLSGETGLSIEAVGSRPPESSRTDSAERSPFVVVRFPRGAARAVAWRGPLSSESIDRIVDSPLRSDVANRLAKGATAVWILVRSGNADADADAERTLVTALKELESSLELPEIEEEDLGLTSLGRDETAALAVEFPLLRLDRGDAAEAVFLGALLGCDRDLVPPPDEALKPIAIPVFGRGRALYAFLGAGIAAPLLREAGLFLTGPCSCQVKVQNPGVDLLISFDWDAHVTARSKSDRDLPTELPGFSEFLPIDGVQIVEASPPASTSDDAFGESAVVETAAESSDAKNYGISSVAVGKEEGPLLGPKVESGLDGIGVRSTEQRAGLEAESPDVGIEMSVPSSGAAAAVDSIPRPSEPEAGSASTPRSAQDPAVSRPESPRLKDRSRTILYVAAAALLSGLIVVSWISRASSRARREELERTGPAPAAKASQGLRQDRDTP
jgi:hypothetical protein